MDPIVVVNTIHVRRSPASVFDFTQDYGRRTSWDRTIRSARLLERDPPVLSVELDGGVRCTFRYRLFRRPERTSMAIEDVRSWWMAGGGGSWEYVADGEGTRWTATNSIVLRRGLVTWFLRGLVRQRAAAGLGEAMERARMLIEADAPR